MTHVGIYVGDGLMVDRSTSERPVNLRSVDTFTFYQGRRLPQFEAAPKDDPDELEPGLVRTLKGYFHPEVDGEGVKGTVDTVDGKRYTGRVWGKRRVFVDGKPGPWEPMVDEEILIRFKVDDE